MVNSRDCTPLTRSAMAVSSRAQATVGQVSIIIPEYLRALKVRMCSRYCSFETAPLNLTAVQLHAVSMLHYLNVKGACGVTSGFHPEI